MCGQLFVPRVEQLLGGFPPGDEEASQEVGVVNLAESGISRGVQPSVECLGARGCDLVCNSARIDTGRRRYRTDQPLGAEALKLPIDVPDAQGVPGGPPVLLHEGVSVSGPRSEEHTSELQSLRHLV